jgi:hypothetical protein
MSRYQIETNAAIAYKNLRIAQVAIVEGNFWLAKSFLRTAITAANKAGCKRVACLAMQAMQNVARA